MVTPLLSQDKWPHLGGVGRAQGRWPGLQHLPLGQESHLVFPDTKLRHKTESGHFGHWKFQPSRPDL